MRLLRNGPPGPLGPHGPEGPERLLKWYDFVEDPIPLIPGGKAITSFTLPKAPAIFGPEIAIGPLSIMLDRILLDDYEELKATIVWNFGLTTTDPGPGPQLVLASQQMQFSIWRDAPLTGTRLCTVIDSGSMTDFLPNTPPGTPLTNTVTTSFICTDTGVIGTPHNYFLTGAAGVANGFFESSSMMGFPTPITSFASPTVTEVHFSGSVIDENKT